MSQSVHVRKVKQVVRMKTNRVYEPVVFTYEVAEELGISEEEAHEALKASSHVNQKEIDGTSVWW